MQPSLWLFSSVWWPKIYRIKFRSQKHEIYYLQNRLGTLDVLFLMLIEKETLSTSSAI